MKSSKIAAALFVAAALSTLTGSGVAEADVVTDWNETALRLTATMPPPVHGRIVATMHAAVYDAVNAIDHRHAVYAVEAKARPGTSLVASAATAAHGVLVRMLPQRQAELDSALVASLGKIPEGSGKSEGVALGKEVAERMVAMRSSDGMNAKANYRFEAGPGIYQATPPMNQLPVLPQFRAVKPFLLKDVMQIALPGPPPLTSAAYARDVNEIKLMGARASNTRSAEQTAVAIFWAASEFLPWNAAARAAVQVHSSSVANSARLFALLNMAMADALIVAFEGKYRFNAWRPVTAIRNAASANNPAIIADPKWEPLLVTPPHQEYPCAHCITSGAAEAVLHAFYGSGGIDINVVLPDLGVLQHYRSFSEITHEVENARVWGGIHYRSSAEHGTQVGRKIGEYGVREYLQPVNK